MVILLVLHVYWFSLIVRVAYAALTKEGEVINILPPGIFFPLFCCLLIFSISTFSKNSFRNMIRVSNSLDLDQVDVLLGLIWVKEVFPPGTFFPLFCCLLIFQNQLF